MQKGKILSAVASSLASLTPEFGEVKIPHLSATTMAIGSGNIILLLVRKDIFKPLFPNRVAW